GEQRVQALLALQREQGDAAAALAWKTVLEDHESQDKFVAAGVWAAIREHHGGALRTPYGALIASHTLVMQALHAPASRLSVSGYQQRLAGSIGEIYLGMDDTGPGCPYAQQSAATNAAISAITRAEAFALAQALTGGIVQKFVEGETLIAQMANLPRWELNLNAKEVFDLLLGGLCEAWFGMRKDGPVVYGPARWDWTPGQAPTYPGHFTAPSRHTFQPRPEAMVEDYGRQWGRALTAGMRTFVQQQLASGKPPTAPLARAIFAAFPGQVDPLARTMVGAMMGFVPTLDGNLKLTLNEWLRDGSFWQLRQALQDAPGPTALDDAERWLERPLRQALQLRPSPELVWRTAASDERLGPLTLQAGDTVVLALVSATQQSLAAGDDDVYPVFGGNSRLAHPPTHACPGYDAAMGVLLGTLHALLTLPQTLRPSPAPLAFTLEGPLQTQSLPAPRPLPDSGPTPASPGWLLAEGDSWFDGWGRDGDPQRTDLLLALQRQHGWQIDELADAGDTLDRIASPAQLAQFTRRLRRMQALGRLPRAVLLGGGGNDVVGKKLVDLLHRCDPGLPALNDAGRALIHVTLQGHLRDALRHYFAATQQHLGHELPVLVHGYDHPVPDGRGAFGAASPMAWLQPWFVIMKYLSDADQRRAAHELIDELNGMLALLAGSPEFRGRLFHVDLRGTLDNGSGYRDDWENELHPTAAGFRKVAGVVAQHLAGLP
ncbi:MAG: hypothetical protein WAQ05_21120, partial [Rubrivivax sp.]